MNDNNRDWSLLEEDFKNNVKLKTKNGSCKFESNDYNDMDIYCGSISK